MNISLLSSPFVSTLKKVNFNSTNPIAFKGNTKCDSFEHSGEVRILALELQKNDEELKAIYQELGKHEANEPKIIGSYYSIERRLSGEKWDKWHDELKELRTRKTNTEKRRNQLIAQYNPNLAFLLDESISWPRKKSVLASNPELKQPRELKKFKKPHDYDNSYFANIWKNPKYFIMFKTNIGSILDSSYPGNKENYKRLSQEDLLSYVEICEKYGIDSKDIHRYVQDGYFEPVKLIDLISGEEENVHAIDFKNPVNLEGVERHNIIASSVSKYTKDDEWISVSNLVKLGFGSEEEINKAIKFKQLRSTKCQKMVDGTVQDITYVNYKRGEGALQYLRNQNKNIVSLEELAKRTRTSVSEIEDDVVAKENRCIPYYLFESDKGKILFNLNSEKIKDYVDKKDFEYSLVKEERRKNASLRMKIVYELCSDIKAYAQKLRSQDPEIDEIFKIKDEIKDYNERKEKGLVSDDEVEPFLTKRQRKKIEIFYRRVMYPLSAKYRNCNESDDRKKRYDEFMNAMTRAKIAVSEYKEGGINNVSDEEIKNIMIAKLGA